MTGSTNLAIRPFRNERLPWLLAGLILGGALLVSVAHARFIGRLLSGTEANTVRLVREDEARIARLEEAVAKEPPLRLEAEELTRLRAFKDLVDRRVFPWRHLLSDLEGLLSEDVRLTSIAPTPTKSGNGVSVLLAGEARTKDATFSFAEALDASPAFSDAVLKSVAQEEDGRIKFAIECLFDVDATAAANAAKAAAKAKIAEGLPALPPAASPRPGSTP